MQLTPSKARQLDRQTVLRLRLAGTDLPAVTQRNGAWFAISPVSRLTLATPWRTPQEALASVVQHRWQVE